ncbi:hypothetical protein NliqN6_6166 [Naganishia liquefaciens]|uniref:Leucine-rich repeat domain-containing protein n=1 Tax=Naganishia liquefaciens TaxID=104408 RepID=A0A8H3U0X2_9TREE|nr:hypothetical protein NliqN6_6166 [Naganishia liquefaciens]
MAPPIRGDAYLVKLLKYLDTHKSRLAAPPHAAAAPSSATGTATDTATDTTAGSLWQQTYTIATLGLDPSSAPLNPALATVFSLGLSSAAGAPAAAAAQQQHVSHRARKPLTLRLPPDRILFLLLMFQASTTPAISTSPLIRPTDVALPTGVAVHPAASPDGADGQVREGDVASVRSWVGSLRSVGGAFAGGGGGRKADSWTSWFGGGTKRKEAALDIETTLKALFAALTLLPSLCVPAPTTSDPRIEDLDQQGVYTRLGGLDVRVPLAIFRSLVSLELDGLDPRAVIIPTLPGLKALTIKDVPDGEDWLEDLLCEAHEENTPTTIRFPSLQYLSLPNTSLLTFPLPDGYISSTLTHLDVSGNLLNALPATLAQLTALQSLNFRTNLVTSVRNAVKLVPCVRALNLRDNKIDCLAGLDALRELQRVDVRHNTLHDVDELSRLATLPWLREVWAAGNPFTTAEDNEDARWKVRVWEAFVVEQGEDVMERLSLDGYLATWAERRAVAARVRRRGRRASGRELAASLRAPTERPDTGATTLSSRLGPQDVSTWTTTPTTTPTPKSRRKQRIVELESTARELAVDPEPRGDRVKLALEDALESPIANVDETTPTPGHQNGNGNGHSKTEVDGPTAETRSPLPEATSTEGGEDLRKRMEALRTEVGDSWLSVLAGQAKGLPAPAPAPAPGPAPAPPGSEALHQPTGAPSAVQVIQVRRKAGKGKGKK